LGSDVAIRGVDTSFSNHEDQLMISRKAQATWTDTLEDGEGTVESDGFSGSYSFASRFEDGDGVSPEELIGDAHASCYSMALAHELEEAGYTPVSVRSTAEVYFDPDTLSIPKIELRTEATVDGIEETTFQDIAEAAKDGCPVSKALAGTDIKLVSARLQL
jgi:osmotically inducible protein OsmC